MKVAFQGFKGAYSEEAAHRYFKESIETIGYELSEEVMDALLSKEVTMAILPVENSIVGTVAVNLDLIQKHPVFVTGEIYLPIHHHLLAHKGVCLQDIKEATSHPIALAQCRDYLIRNGIKISNGFDTAGSCKDLSESSNMNLAAIGSRFCADAYDLEIINDDIQKTRNNITRFFIVVREEEITEEIHQNKTSISFTAHHQPGALLNCLQIFNKYNINLSKLESRPIVENPFDYTFFVDFTEGLREQKTIDCLKELNRDAHNVKILGSYQQAIKPNIES